MAQSAIPVPKLAVTPAEAAEALGVSRKHFDYNVLPRLKTVRCGRRVIVPVSELRRFLNDQEPAAA